MEITKEQLYQALYTWEGMHRKGETMTVEEAQQMGINGPQSFCGVC